MHESRLVKQWEHAIEVLEEILEERKRLVLRGKRLENAAGEYVAEDFRLPIHPLIVIHVRRGDHILERGITRLLVDPLNTLGRKDRKPR